jgi:hypothetical protein
VKYPIFARFLALCRVRSITIPTIGLGSLHSIAPKPIVGIVFPRARRSAKIRAKSLIVSNKTNVITAHLCSETAVFSVLLYFCTVYVFTVNFLGKKAITCSLVV